MRRVNFWIVVVALFLGGSAVVSWNQFAVRKTGVVATVFLDGRCLRTINLDQVTKAYSFTVSGEGSNTVSVEPGRIRISSADCPTKLCVRQGWLSPGGLPLICLPHRLVISVEGATTVSVDNVSQ
ncbi:MAG: hypothetical protein CSA35_09130 [Dethiosulfovibrio peptidovorans]|nr:MAG: hypothetical protein CSA35_09130 [Dethiosulfovibrio peptidovorans]